MDILSNEQGGFWNFRLTLYNINITYNANQAFQTQIDKIKPHCC